MLWSDIEDVNLLLSFIAVDRYIYMYLYMPLIVHFTAVKFYKRGDLQYKGSDSQSKEYLL